MKRKLISCLAVAYFGLSSMTLYAGNIDTEAIQTESVVETDVQPAPYIYTCCTGTPQLTWVDVFTLHKMDEFGNCFRVEFYGNQYCTRCGTIWKEEVYYRYEFGCGQNHKK